MSDVRIYDGEVRELRWENDQGERAGSVIVAGGFRYLDGLTQLLRDSGAQAVEVIRHNPDPRRGI